MVQCMTNPRYILSDIAHNLFAGPILLDIDCMLFKIESESHRYYHTLEHVYSVFCELEFNSKNRLLDFLFALCHDIVYDPKRNDNEYQSIVYISQIETISSLNFFDELKSAIRSTQHWNDVNRFTTADRSDVLMTFCYNQVEYFKKIRKEYSFVPWETFVESHLEIVSKIRQAQQLKDNGYEKMVRRFKQKQIIVRYQQSWNSWSKKPPRVCVSFKESFRAKEFVSEKFKHRMNKWS